VDACIDSHRFVARISAVAPIADVTSPARHLTGPRRQVLGALETCGPAGPAGIARCWQARHPADARYVGGGLQAMVSHLLWKLEALDWVEPVDEGYAITPDGASALSTSSRG
jgi:hypothetical protein